MKTYTATQLNKSPQEVFAAAKEDGAVIIEHDRHSTGSFRITWKRDVSAEEVIAVAKIFGEQDISSANRLFDKADGRYCTGEGE